MKTNAEIAQRTDTNNINHGVMKIKIVGLRVLDAEKEALKWT